MLLSWAPNIYYFNIEQDIIIENISKLKHSKPIITLGIIKLSELTRQQSEARHFNITGNQQSEGLL